MTVLDHILTCDIERIKLYEEQHKLINQDISGYDEEEKKEHAERLTAVNERLDLIGANSAEAKAITILCGLGF